MILGTVSLAVSATPTATNTTTTVTYPSALVTSSYQLMTSITSIDQGIDQSSPIVAYNITIAGQSITIFRVRFYSVVLPRIAYAKLTYLCVDKAIRDLQFYVFDVYFGDGKPGVLPGSSTNGDFIFNFTTRINRRLIVGPSTYVVEPFIKGFKIINWFLAYSIDLTTTVLNESHFRIDVRSAVVSTQ